MNIGLVFAELRIHLPTQVNSMLAIQPDYDSDWNQMIN